MDEKKEIAPADCSADGASRGRFGKKPGCRGQKRAKRRNRQVQGTMGAVFGKAPQGEQADLAIYQIFYLFQRRDDLSVFGVHVSSLCVRGEDGGDGIYLAPLELPWGGKWTIIGYAVAHNEAGEVIIGGGLGYTLSFWIGSFLAQCINFPLQRNITYKSKGKIPFQIMWYFIAWVLITFATTALNSLWLPVCAGASAQCGVSDYQYRGGRRNLYGHFLPDFQDRFPRGGSEKESGRRNCREKGLKSKQ